MKPFTKQIIGTILAFMVMGTTCLLLANIWGFIQDENALYKIIGSIIVFGGGTSGTLAITDKFFSPPTDPTIPDALRK